jgi:hypothetical protein
MMQRAHLPSVVVEKALSKPPANRQTVSTVGKRSRSAYGNAMKRSMVSQKRERVVPRNTAPCVNCGGDDSEGLVLLCDRCNNAYHADCVRFKGALMGDWFCPPCAEQSLHTGV